MEKLQVGKIVNTYGLKGELKILINPLFTDFILKARAKLIVNELEYQVVNYEMENNLWYVTFKDHLDINLVEKLKGSLVYLNESELAKPVNGYYRYQLQGFQVLNQDLDLIGEVFVVESTGFQDIIRIKREKKDILIPLVKPFVKRIDYLKRIIIIEPIEGLI